MATARRRHRAPKARCRRSRTPSRARRSRPRPEAAQTSIVATSLWIPSDSNEVIAAAATAAAPHRRGRRRRAAAAARACVTATTARARRSRRRPKERNATNVTNQSPTNWRTTTWARAAAARRRCRARLRGVAQSPTWAARGGALRAYDQVGSEKNARHTQFQYAPTSLEPSSQHPRASPRVPEIPLVCIARVGGLA